tara:strand:+ start:80 stop:364 length:285 start_codon:yes stop_codon:yes gene_type:complete
MPLLRLFVPLLFLFSFGGISYGRGSFESVKELADKYELKMPLFTSRCSAARKIYYKAAAKNSYEEIKADPLFGRVRVYAYWNCYGHRDWPPAAF